MLVWHGLVQRLAFSLHCTRVDLVISIWHWSVILSGSWILYHCKIWPILSVCNSKCLEKRPFILLWMVGNYEIKYDMIHRTLQFVILTLCCPPPLTCTTTVSTYFDYSYPFPVLKTCHIDLCHINHIPLMCLSLKFMPLEIKNIFRSPTTAQSHSQKSWHTPKL